ncbi:uncharacterized protein LOC130656463 [Hydractinia symbiolongicarpus]|uniref:uncharacterized protein LOC130656463 n=1 Tax=Hydractinia symbiolongicarpus TaxID=13093 RepID=UPI00254EAE6B|nr:uncharacterized protein LOC130656463 [Hydractinia symbiolongicarpus]
MVTTLDKNKLWQQLNDLSNCCADVAINGHDIGKRDNIIVMLGNTQSMLSRYCVGDDELATVQTILRSTGFLNSLSKLLGCDKFVTFLVLKLMTFLFKTLPECFLQEYSEDILKKSCSEHLELRATLLSVIIQCLKSKERMEKRLAVVKAIMDYLELSAGLCIHEIKELYSLEVKSEKFILLLRCCMNILKAIKLTYTTGQQITATLLKTCSVLVTSLTGLGIQVFAKEGVPKKLVKQRHLLWRYFLKSFHSILDFSKVCSDQALVNCFASVCFDFAEVMIQPNQLKNLCIIESNFVGLPNIMTWNSFSLFMDDCSARKLIIFELEVLNLQLHECDDIRLRLSTIFSILYKFPRINNVSTNLIEVLLEVFMEQDDELVKAVYLLQKLFLKAGSLSIQYGEDINPLRIFFQLTKSLSFDESVLLDWLISDESNFLLYFQQFLQYTGENFALLSQTVETSPMKNFKKSTKDIDTAVCQLSLEADKKTRNIVGYSSSEDEEDHKDEYEHTVKGKMASEAVDNLMSCLIRLNLKLDRLNTQNLLPAGLNLIVDQLDMIERLYEE